MTPTPLLQHFYNLTEHLEPGDPLGITRTEAQAIADACIIPEVNWTGLGIRVHIPAPDDLNDRWHQLADEGTGTILGHRVVIIPDTWQHTPTHDQSDAAESAGTGPTNPPPPTTYNDNPTTTRRIVHNPR